MKKYFVLLLSFACMTAAAGVPPNSTQAIVGIADGWNSNHVTINLFEKGQGGWKLVAGPIPGRLGKNGLAWGYGLTKERTKAAPVKKEGDLRSPAGIFAIGQIYGTVTNLKKNSLLPYRKVTPNDLWVEDVNSPYYNNHLVLDHPAASPWELKQQMHLNDYAHSIKLFIKHNAPGDPGRPVAGGGSSIFFHIWRHDGEATTAGCTTMSEENLRMIISWIDPRRNPVYILMPRDEYIVRRSVWQLP